QMKRTTIVILLIVYTARFSFGQSQSLSIPLGDISLKEMFAIIQRESGMAVFYSDEVVNDEMRTTIRANEASLTKLLDETLPTHQLSYQIIDGKFLVITPRGNRIKADKPQSISGQVKNSQSLPIAFASVKLMVRDS